MNSVTVLITMLPFSSLERFTESFRESSPATLLAIRRGTLPFASNAFDTPFSPHDSMPWHENAMSRQDFILVFLSASA